MDKYGVVLDDEKAKTSSAEKRCPKCGAVLDTYEEEAAAIPQCPNCGTEPFEKRDEKK